MTKDEALAKFDSGWWETASSRDIVKFQLFEPRLCMPFDAFQKAVEVMLDRPIWIHEFGLDLNDLKSEFRAVMAEDREQ